MKLKKFLKTKKNQQWFTAEEFAHFSKNNFLCEEHKLDLHIGVGYKLINCHISYKLELLDFSKENPNAVWLYQEWEKCDIFDQEESLLVYCKICDKNIRSFKKQPELKFLQKLRREAKLFKYGRK